MSVPSTEAASWHWLGLDGNEVAGDEWELVTGLSTGAIEATTLVWKRGWVEWAPANRIAELATAIPAAKRETAREPRRDALVVKPPARPVARRDEALPPPRPGLASKPKLSPPNPAPMPATSPAPEQPVRARDTLPPSSFGVLNTNKAASPPPKPVRPALKRARMPMPTLGDEPLHQSATSTLRPPNAVPPPPRGVPAMPIEIDEGADSERIEVTATPLPSVIVAQSMQGEVEHFPSSPPPEPRRAAPTPGFVSPDPAHGLDSTLDTAGSPSKSAQQLQLIQKSRTTSPDLVHTDAAQRRSVRQSMRNSMASIVERARPPAISVTGRALLALLVLAGVSGALAVMVVVLFMTRGKAGPSTASGPASSSSGQALERGRGSCISAQPAARLAAAIDRAVPISIATLPNGKLAIGFGATKTLAAGLSIDPAQFDAAQVFEADGELGLRGVVPSSKAGASTFVVDRENPGFETTRTVDGDPRFTLGQSAEGFARATSGGAPKVIWPGGGKEKITEPRVAEMPDGGYLVTFRRGGQYGSVHAGWLGKDGSPKSALFKVESGAKFAGTPAVGVNDRGALLAFAARDTTTAAWRLLLAPGAALEAPARAREFRPPDVSSGGAIAPAVAGLSGDRWLLQWTEGASGNYRVRAQTLSADLQPIDPPILVSPKGANAGQGILWVNGVHAISLFILTTAGKDELWGASLKCE